MAKKVLRVHNSKIVSCSSVIANKPKETGLPSVVQTGRCSLTVGCVSRAEKTASELELWGKAGTFNGAALWKTVLSFELWLDKVPTTIWSSIVLWFTISDGELGSGVVD